MTAKAAVETLGTLATRAIESKLISQGRLCLVQKLLRNPTVRIKNLEATRTKLEKLVEDGDKNLHFICDFDQTMSLYWIRDKVTGALTRNISCHGVPGRYSKLDPNFRKVTDNLLHTYYPIEINKTMTHDEKIPYMVEWWEKSHAAMISQNLTREDIRAMAEESPMQLRPGVDTLLRLCQKRNVPFLVFSAGIGNVIDETLKAHKLMYPNMHIVSNMMHFNEQGVVDGFDDPLIHCFNKSEFQLETTPYYPQIENRTNVVLVGDSLGDLQMSQGVRHDLCLTIGFCNHDFEALEPRYMDAFDIVIMRDANMNPVLDIVESIQ